MAAKSKLTAVQPETVAPRKPKVLIYGPPGVGKTWVALDFPAVYFFDTEGGALRSHYQEKLKTSGGMYFGPEQGSLEFDTVIGQVEALATEKHPFKTMVFDSASKLFNTAISDEQLRLGSADAFGASKKVPIRQMVRLLRWANRADMNVLFIAHQKDLWGKEDKGQREVVGQTFDAWEKLEYELDLVLRVSKIGKGDNAKRYGNIGKSRLASFPEGEQFNWSYADFADRYGKEIIEKAVEPVVLATAEQVAEVTKLLDIVKLPEATVDKWFTKAGVDTFNDMDNATITKVLGFLKERMMAPL